MNPNLQKSLFDGLKCFEPPVAKLLSYYYSTKVSYFQDIFKTRDYMHLTVAFTIYKDCLTVVVPWNFYFSVLHLLHILPDLFFTLNQYSTYFYGFLIHSMLYMCYINPYIWEVWLWSQSKALWKIYVRRAMTMQILLSKRKIFPSRPRLPHFERTSSLPHFTVWCENLLNNFLDLQHWIRVDAVDLYFYRVLFYYLFYQ